MSNNNVGKNDFKDKINCFFENLSGIIGTNEGNCKVRHPEESICSIVVWFVVFLIIVFLIALSFHYCFQDRSYGIIFIIMMGCILLSGTAIGIIALVKTIPLLGKAIDQHNKMEEELLNAVIKSVEENQEYGRLKEKTQTAIIERCAKTFLDEEVRNGDNQRKLAIIQQEYISHLADIALEMVKSNNNGQGQESDQQMINQIIQQLIRQSNGQQ